MGGGELLWQGTTTVNTVGALVVPPALSGVLLTCGHFLFYTGLEAPSPPTKALAASHSIVGGALTSGLIFPAPRIWLPSPDSGW